MIKNKQWKSVKIKWGKEKGNDTWDFALVKATGNGNEAAKNYCTSSGFNKSVSEDWVTVYQNLGWNVNKKGENGKEICIWKVPNEGSACGRAISCL